MEEAATLEQEPEEVEGAEERTSNGGLRVTDINQGRAERRTLLGHFRDAGWKHGHRAEIAWNEFEASAESRALTFTSGVSTVDKLARDAGGFGADSRYAWPAFPRISVDAGITSVDVLTQTARTLPTPANVVRNLDAVTDKPEVANTIAVSNLALKQVAAVDSGIPERLPREQHDREHHRPGPAPRRQRGTGQARSGRARGEWIPGTRHRSAARLDPEGDDHDLRGRLRPGHRHPDAGERRPRLDADVQVLVDPHDGAGRPLAADVDADPDPLAWAERRQPSARLPGSGGKPGADLRRPLVAVVAPIRDLCNGLVLLP
jgi:hypothetical protein